MAEIQHTFCRICESLCGLEIHTENGKITQILPDEKHVATQGFACAKGLKQQRMYDSPDRLKYPLKRTEEGFVRISWDQALSEIGQKVQQLKKDFTADSIALYVGTAAGFGVLHPAFAQGFMTGLGSKSLYSSSTQDCSNKFAASHAIYGFPFTQPFPDLHHTNCLIIVGANPVISKWSFLQVPNPGKHLKDIEQRGGKVFIIDPRKTETAKIAGEHIFIRPGTDVFFYLSFLNEVLKANAIDKEKLQFMKGFEHLEELAAPWTAERTSEITTIDPEKMREMVKYYIEANGASIYSSTGVNMGGNGVLAFWIQEVINAITGNLDKKGGTIVGKGVTDFIKFGKKNGTLMRKDKSRIGNLDSVNDAFPGGVLADEILTPGDKQVKALIVTGGNPLITMPNSNRLRKALSQLELLVVLDILPTETASLAHYILPCTSPLQRPDLPFIFPLMLGLQAKPYLQATKAILEPEYEQRDEATIYIDLAKACKAPLFKSGVAQNFFEFLKWIHSFRLKKGKQKSLPQIFLLNLLLKITGQVGFKKLLKFTHGKLRPDHEISGFLGKRVVTDDGLVDLAPEKLLSHSKNVLGKSFEYEKEHLNHFKLITKRAVTTHNSWTHNYEEFVSADKNTNYLYMHPNDGQKIGIKELDLVDVSSQTATVRLPVRFISELMISTVALPHGWGHQSSLLQVANKTKGVNVNILAADGPENLEKSSGMALLTGILVNIKPAQEKLYSESWSGLKEDLWEVKKILE